MDTSVAATAEPADFGPLVYDFVTSPGFAGLLAVLAAVIAYVAATGNARRDRWWKRAEYALDRTLSTDEAEQLVGLAMLRTLRSRNHREQDFIKAATDVFLDPNADGDESDDPPPTNPPPRPRPRSRGSVSPHVSPRPGRSSRVRSPWSLRGFLGRDRRQ